jgi:Asp-tRNA(Asn)/Glu-tRNA(Gln) amidotransferase A subunit family amidase
VVAGSQIDWKAVLSVQTGFPAITLPAGFTPGGFPVGIGSFDRPLAETVSFALGSWQFSLNFIQSGPDSRNC